MKKIILFAILVLNINAFGQIPTNGLVGYWPFNGNANDESGNGNKGILHGVTLTNDRFGNANKAYNFDGVSNYIDVADANSLDFGTTTSFTVACWIKTAGTNNVFHGIVTKSTVAPSTELGWQFGSQYNKLQNEFGGGTTTANFTGNTLINDNNWHLAIFIVDRVSNTSSYYIDGNFDKSLVSTNFSLNVSNSRPMYIGADRQLGSPYFFNGSIDDIRIYNRALNQSEIAALYNESICYQSVTVTDTLIINANLTGFNPVKYSNTIKVYPNPTKDAITIDCGNNFSTLSGYTVKITNSLSQTVYTSKVNQQTTSIKLNSWTGKGIYFVHLIDASSNTIDIKKIVLQ